MKKQICNITFLAMILVISACAPSSHDKVFSDLRKDEYKFKPRNEDREIVSSLSDNFQIQSVLGVDSAQRTQTPWIDNSVEIFKLAENSILLGDQVQAADRNQYKKFGHDLLKLFYQSKENSTQFDKTQSLFLPAALGFEGKKIKAMLTKIGSGENIQGAQKVFANHHIVWPASQPTLHPADFIKSIKAYLLGTADLFLQNGVGKDFVKSFSAQLDRDYLQVLNRGEIKLKDTDQNQPLKLSSSLINEVIQSLTFIPQDAIKPLLESLVKAKKYAELIEPKHSSGVPQVDRLVQVIASIWLDLTPQQREKYIKPANEMLYTKLNSFSDKLTSWLAGRTELSITDKEYYYSGFFKSGFIDRLGTSCHNDIHANLMTWLNLNDNQKASLRNQNPEIFNIFSRYTTNEIKSDILVYFEDGVFDAPLVGGSIISKFNSEVYPVCISRIQTILDKSINLYLLSELDIQIRNWGSMIEKIVADKTMENLNSITAAIDSPEEFKAYFNKLATPILNDLMFSDSTLNGIENSRVQLYVDNKTQLNTKRANFNQFDSGAETLGVSLAAQYHRILELPEFENKAVNSKEYYKIVFSQMNKMISMIGFRTIDNKLATSLHRNFNGNIPDLDVYKYDCDSKKSEAQRIKKERYDDALKNGRTPSLDDYVDIREDCQGFENYRQNIYEIPDNMTVVGAFTPGQYQKLSSARSQAEIIRGSALMLQYFNDWRGPNDFDLGMGKEKYSDMDLFPKSAFVNLAVAAMTVSLRGLQRENSALKLFNAEGKEITDWVEKGIPDPDTVTGPVDPSKQIVQAAIVDLSAAGPSQTVNLQDLAYFMVSVDEFLKATDGIEKTHASVINPPDKKIKDNLQAILKGRKLLKMMMFGMSNFIIARMQDEDGGFSSKYSLETNQIVKGPRTLEVQLSVIDALLRTYGQWGGEGALVSAIETYYFMNQQLWDSQTSFYRTSEDKNSGEIKPYLYLKAVMNFNNMAPHLSGNSKAQAERLFDYYSTAFLKWNQASQPMANLAQ